MSGDNQPLGVRGDDSLTRALRNDAPKTVFYRIMAGFTRAFAKPG